jgi:hypothetical protein
MANVFDELVSRGMRAGVMPGKTAESREWYRTAAGLRKNTSINTFLKEEKRRKNNIKVGSMYMFVYDPKHKETLPYYDTVPLIFPFEARGDSFLGLNVHYLPPRLRAKLMDGLYEYSNNKKYDETTKIKLSYQLLKSVSKLKYYKPCVKMYLKSHVKTSFVYIYPNEWDIALFLPMAKWQKQSGNYVHQQSRKIIDNA